jgi:hypothetical protein
MGSEDGAVHTQDRGARAVRDMHELGSADGQHRTVGRATTRSQRRATLGERHRDLQLGSDGEDLDAAAVKLLRTLES